MSQSRQLAAIMFTDIVGYTALMGNDEQKAFELLKKNRELQKPIIEQFNGRWIKELGDGVMASFNTVSDAVNAAIKIQEDCNAAKDFQLRIGIHLGEVVFENDDVFGDGVNIASRIQAIANPGSIYISEAVHNSISNKKDLHTKFVKEQKLKNVKEPVKIYQVIAEGVVQHQLNIGQKIRPKPRVLFISASIIALLIAGYFIQKVFTIQKSSQKNATNESSEKTIAVLPFRNISDDKQQEYFSDGLSEGLINMFTRLPGLKVTGPTSSFAFKGKNEDLRTIGKKLGVEYLLEGSVLKSGNTLRITAQLIKAADGTLLWSETFPRELNDIFEVQDQIIASVTNALKVTLLNKDKPSSKFKTKPEAYNDFLRGRFIYENSTELSQDERAMVWFKEAIKKDSSFSLAWTYLSMVYWRQSKSPVDLEFKKARQAAFKALELDSSSGIAAANVAEILDNEFNFHAALKKIDLALKLEPENPYVLRNAGRFYTYLGRHDESIDFCKRALQNDPIQFSAFVYLIKAYFHAQRFDKALETYVRLKKDAASPLHIESREYFDILILTNRLEEARKETDKINQPGLILFETGLGLYESVVLQAKQGHKIEAVIMINQLIKKYPEMAYHISLAFTYAGDYEKAIDWLETAYKKKTWYLVYVNVEPAFKQLRNNARFQKLINLMNFPK